MICASLHPILILSDLAKEIFACTAQYLGYIPVSNWPF